MFLQDLFGSATSRLPNLSATSDLLRAFWRWLVITFMLGAVFFVSVMMASQIVDHHLAAAMVGACLGFAIWYLCAFVHEMGHAIAAWLIGWRVHVIAVADFAYAPRAKTLIRIPEHGQEQEIGGWVLATPPPEVPWIAGLAAFTLGGVVANFVFGGLAILAAFGLPGSEGPLFFVLVALGLSSAIIAVANLIPLSKPGVWKSDGATLIGALRGEAPPPHEQKAARLLAMVMDGVPAEEWDPCSLRQLMDDTSIDRAAVDPLLLSYAFGVADLATAKTVLERMVVTDAKESFELRCMYAFAVTMVDRDGPQALRILEPLPNKYAKKSFSYWRARATATHLLGRSEEAREAVEKARRTGRKSGQTPDRDDEEVFQAIERGQDLPRLEPRGRLGLSEAAPKETG